MVAPRGRIEAPGTVGAPLSLGRAVTLATAGSTIRLAAGTYQTAGLTIDRPLTLEAEPGTTVILKGSAVIPAEQWEPAGRGWRTPWTAAAVTRTQAVSGPMIAASSFSPSTSPVTTGIEIERVVAPQHRLAIDGHPMTLVAASTDVGANSFYIDTVGKWLYVDQDPSLHTIEAGSADVGILVTGSNVNIIGIGISEFADIGLRIGGTNTVVNNGNFSHNGVNGLDINEETNGTVENSTMSYNGQVGLEASHSSGITIQTNTINNNNTANYNVSQAAAGLKGTNITNMTVRGNVVANNASNAIWFDESSTRITIANNQVYGNKCFGIYFELSNTVLVVGNQVHDNVQSGIGIHFTYAARIYNNTIVSNGTNLDVSAAYNRSPYDMYHATVANNIIWGAKTLMVDLYRYNGCSTYVYTEVDYNAYYRSSTGSPKTDVNYCNKLYTTMSAFHSGTGYEAHGIEYSGTDPFFVSASSKNYHLKSGSPAIHRGQALPADAAAALGVKSGVTVSMGALQ